MLIIKFQLQRNMNTFETQVLKAKAELEISKIRLELYNFGLKILYKEQAENLANGSLFHCNTNYRATNRTFEMSQSEIDFINQRLDKIDLISNQIYRNDYNTKKVRVKSY